MTSATCARGLVMELYDNLGNKLFLYTRGILHYFNVRSKANMCQFNLPHGNDNKKV